MRKTLTWLALAAAVAWLAYLALREEQTLIASATASPRDLQQTYSEEGRTRLKNRYHIAGRGAPYRPGCHGGRPHAGTDPALSTQVPQRPEGHLLLYRGHANGAVEGRRCLG